MEAKEKSKHSRDPQFYYSSCWDRAENPQYRGCVLLSEGSLFLCLPVDEKGGPKRFDRQAPPSFRLVMLYGGGVALFSFALGALTHTPVLFIIPMVIYGIWATIMIHRRQQVLSWRPLKREFENLRRIFKSRAPIEDAIAFLRNRGSSVREFPISDLADVTFRTCIWRKEWLVWTRMISESANLNWLVGKSIEKMLQKRIFEVTVK